MSDVMILQDKQDLIVKTMVSRPNVLSDENIKNFPDNRQLIKAPAQEQIESLNQLIKIDREQINKIKEIEVLPVDSNFLEYSKLNRQIFEKRLEDNQLSVQKFQLILDENITNKQQFEENISNLRQKESEIDFAIIQLENQLKNIRKTAGK
ncbi:MAG: hypothetical protein M3033_00985 [Acidobacteriota bacterium]|nr:hypothetical protein [Acidobacteriota bacterium]